MKYISTRGQAPVLDFKDVLLSGLASDGGLYVPQEYPSFSADDIRKLQGLSYPDLAAQILRPFVDGALSDGEIVDLTHKAYAHFTHAATAPLKQLDTNLWVMELFYGPTLAFKDYALQLVGLLFDAILSKSGKKITIAGATSGDTGSAAIEACKNRSCIDIFILHPYNRVSEIQRRQMTTVHAPNVFNIAVEGCFDDCQNIVKQLFADAAFRKDYALSAVNSINWARIMAQVVYYFWAALHLGAPDRRVSFAVPTGNFGNIFAGFVAKKMGLPVDKLIVGSNANDILPRFFETGEMKKSQVVPSISPSMDIQVSSNFERLLFEFSGRDAKRVADFMDAFKYEGVYRVPDDIMTEMRKEFQAFRCDDALTKRNMREIFDKTGEVFDPHSAIGYAAGKAYAKADVPTVCLATAHPAKFPNAVRDAVGKTPELPARLEYLKTMRENFTVLPNATDAIKYFIETKVSKKG